MRTALRTVLAALALAIVVPAHSAHAEDLCIPLLTCPSQPPNNPNTPNAPEISGSMLSTGFALVAGVAVMVRGRRRFAK